MPLLPRDSRHRTVLTSSHIFVPQDFGAGEAGGSLQPGGLPLAVHTPQIRHSPREQQPDHHRDGPQRVHRGHQGAEEAADGRGRRAGGQVAHMSLPWGQLLLKPSPLGGPSCCCPILSVLCTGTGAEGSGNQPQNVNVSRMQCSPVLLSLRAVMTSPKNPSQDSPACVMPLPGFLARMFGFRWVFIFSLLNVVSRAVALEKRLPRQLPLGPGRAGSVL